MYFSQNGHVLKFQKSLFFRYKKPCESFPPEVTFSELTSRELFHFYRDLKNGGTPNFRDFGKVLPYNWEFWSKTKMVRMVHRNNFCEMILEISDPKKQIWTKTEVLEGWEISKFSFEVQGWLFRIVSKPEWLLKIFWNIPESFQTKSYIKSYCFKGKSIKIAENRAKYRN